MQADALGGRVGQAGALRPLNPEAESVASDRTAIEHRLTHAPDGPPDWSLDHDQFHQALWAVIQNAAEAAVAGDDPDARVDLTIRFGAEQMVVEVQDSGTGIDPEQATRIFRPFHPTKADGTGIGLSLARHITLAHGGSVTLLATAPTTFRLVVPRPSF